MSTSSLHQALGQDDRVLEVVALPRHEGHQQVLAKSEFTVIGGGPSAMTRPFDLVALADSGCWLMQVSWFERRELVQRVVVSASRLV